jgi:cytochrome c oxidase cbb3-type subunit 1
VQDALTQWWYGHNAVGFFLTAGFLGMMYYFMPKQAERPVYSYRPVDHPLLGADLPLHLGRSAPPALHGAAGLGADAGHGLLDHAVDAVLGRHDQRPDDAVGRLGQAAHRPDHPHDGRRVAFYGMSTFEGPMMSIKAVNSLSHYTDWTIGHVHSGALGWVGMITFGALYYLVPRCGSASGSTRMRWSAGTSGSRPRHRALRGGRCGSRASCRA